MQMYDEVKRMYRYSPIEFSLVIRHGGSFGKFIGYSPIEFSLVIHHGGSFRKFIGHEYREGKTDIFDYMDIDCFMFMNWISWPYNLVDEELGNENDVFPLRVDEQCQTEHDDVNHDRLNEDTYNGLERNTSRDCEYDADSSENEGCKDDADVMIDEDREIDEAEIEVYLFGLKESNHDFIAIGVVRVRGHVEEEVHLISSIRLSCKVNLMETNMLAI
nr:hypothetical protein [Tanacetum cinerariifolium]